MTVRINFLPRTYQAPKQADSRTWVVVGAAAVAIVAVGAYYTNLYAGTLALEAAAGAAQTELQAVKAELARAGQITEREKRVTQAEADLKALTGRNWSGVLLELRESTPKHVTWTSLDAKENQIVLKGTGRGLVDVAQLLGSLIVSPGVEQVWLHYANEKGEKVTVTLKSDDPQNVQQSVQPAPDPSVVPPPQKTDPAVAGGKTDPNVIDLGMFRQFEFELDITLVKAEGGK